MCDQPLCLLQTASASHHHDWYMGQLTQLQLQREASAPATPGISAMQQPQRATKGQDALDGDMREGVIPGDIAGVMRPGVRAPKGSSMP